MYLLYYHAWGVIFKLRVVRVKFRVGGPHLIILLNIILIFIHFMVTGLPIHLQLMELQNLVINFGDYYVEFLIYWNIIYFQYISLRNSVPLPS